MSSVGGIVHCSVADDVPHFQYVQQPLVLGFLLLRFRGSAHVVQDCDGQYAYSKLQQRPLHKNYTCIQKQNEKLGNSFGLCDI